MHAINQPEYVFYDVTRRLHKDRFRTIPFPQVISLLLIQPDTAKVIVTDKSDKRQVQIEFSYRNRTYEPFPVTDFEFMDYLKDYKAGTYPFKKMPVLLCSVGECYEKDQCHYKLIASVFGTLD